MPRFDRTVAALRIVEDAGTVRRRLRIKATGTWRGGSVPLSYDVDLEPGWCWMVADPQVYVVGMAAVPDGDQTRYGHLEGVVPARRPLEPLLWATRLRSRRHVRHDVDGIEQALDIRRRPRP